MKQFKLMPTFLSTLIIILLINLIQACSHTEELKKNGIESSTNSESHNAGQNCMSCHHSKKNEASGYWWNIAGSVFDNNSPAPNAGTIELWTEPNRKGKLVSVLTIDKNGNFYTEKIVDFKGGFYPIIIKNNQILKEMSSKTSEGACNSCHGVSEEKIEIN